MKKFILLFALCALAGCAAQTVISPTYNFGAMQRIGIMAFESPWQSFKGSENVFAKYLMQNGFGVVERANLEDVLREHNISVTGYLSPQTTKMIGQILGVDVLLMGEISTYTPEKKTLTMVENRRVQREPVYTTQTVVMPDGSTAQYQSQTGERVTRQSETTPREVTLPAQVGVVAKLVDVETAEIVWIGTDTASGYSALAAVDGAAKGLVKSLAKEIKKAEKQKGLK
jgi:hypothetical protein